MKKIFAVLIVLTAVILIAKPAAAQFEKCSLDTVKVVNDFSADSKMHSRTTWTFSCQNSTRNFGQMTKLIYTVPLTETSNFEASDSLGTMKVLEGPEYATAVTTAKGSTIGAIFRKPLLITDESTSYGITVEFDSSSLAGTGENGTSSIMPGKQIANPKVTILTTGITETVYPVEKVDYELNLPSGSSVQTVSIGGCAIKGGNIICQNLNQADFNSLEIKWAKPEGVGGLLRKIKENIGNLLPGLTNVFKGLGNSLSKLIRGK